MNTPPLIIEPDDFKNIQAKDNILLVDISNVTQYAQAHIPNAVFLDYSAIIGMNKPTMGLLPSKDKMNAAMSSIGFSDEQHIVVYDEEGGGKAARLIWTLHAFGFENISMINGGLISWANEGHALSNEAVQVNKTQTSLSYTNPNVVADADYIMSRLGADDFALLDARSLAEYDGSRAYAQRPGHIPGAKHYEWTEGLDATKNYRLKDKATLQNELNQLNINPNKETIVYCQTHHRSALSYVMLKHLGYEKVRGYHGSWSEWGNRTDTPIEH